MARYQRWRGEYLSPTIISILRYHSSSELAGTCSDDESDRYYDADPQTSTKLFSHFCIFDNCSKRFEIIRENSLIFSDDPRFPFSCLFFLTRPEPGLGFTWTVRCVGGGGRCCCCCLTWSWSWSWWCPGWFPCCPLTLLGVAVVVAGISRGCFWGGSWGRDWA